MLSKQILRRLRSFLYPLLLRWVQRLAPPSLDAPAIAMVTAAGTQPSQADPTATNRLSIAGPTTAAAAADTLADGPATAADDNEAVDHADADGLFQSGNAREEQGPAERGPAFPMPLPSVVPTGGALRFADERAAFCPGQRQPLSVEEAVLARDMSLLKREAADALAALGAAHALVTSARLAQVQHLRPMVEKGEVPGEALKALAADYQGWQNDQVRLFDALALVMRMQVPPGKVLDQVDPALQEQARQHLASLSLEYQRRQLQHQIRRQG